MALPDGAAQVLAVATRLSVLDQNGYPAVGSNTFTTDSVVLATYAPTIEAGDDLVLKNAAGNIAVHYKHGDMPKYYTATIELTTPDPMFEQMLCGGVLLADSSAALTTPLAAPTGAPAITGGSLAAGSYYYKVTAANQYGETVATAESAAIVVASGVAGTVTLTMPTLVTGQVYWRIYGRTIGAEQFLVQLPVATTTWVDLGTISPLGALPAANTSAGPGAQTGYAAPNLGIVGNPSGVSIEHWGMAVLKGQQVSYLPYWRWSIPGAKNFHASSRTFSNTIMASSYTGEAFENANWGSGPFGDWQFASGQVYQRARAGAATLPSIGLSPVVATV